MKKAVIYAAIIAAGLIVGQIAYSKLTTQFPTLK